MIFDNIKKPSGGIKVIGNKVKCINNTNAETYKYQYVTMQGDSATLYNGTNLAIVIKGGSSGSNIEVITIGA